LYLHTLQHFLKYYAFGGANLPNGGPCLVCILLVLLFVLLYPSLSTLQSGNLTHPPPSTLTCSTIAHNAFFQPASHFAHGRLVLRLLCVFHICIFVHPHL